MKSEQVAEQKWDLQSSAVSTTQHSLKGELGAKDDVFTLSKLATMLNVEGSRGSCLTSAWFILSLVNSV